MLPTSALVFAPFFAMLAAAPAGPPRVAMNLSFIEPSAKTLVAEIAVRDQDIDPSGRFSKKEWQTRPDVCGGFFITLGSRDETACASRWNGASSAEPGRRESLRSAPFVV